MIFRFRGTLLTTMLVAFGALNEAHATTVYMTNDGCANCSTSGDLGAGVYATVTYVQDSDGKSLDFTLTLATDSTGTAVHFHNPADNSHATFAFSLNGDPNVSTLILSNVNDPGTWGLSAATKALSGSGTFDYILANNASGVSGYGGGDLSPLTFKITPAVGALTPNSVVQNSQNTTFNIDIVDSNKSTGNVWDTTTGGSQSVAPEVGTGQLLAISLGLFAVGGWRGRHGKLAR